MTNPSKEEREVIEMIVAYARREAKRWELLVAAYRAAGNNGPYLGQPSWSDFASAIERNEHHKGSST